MAIQTESPVIGQALTVHGLVRIESINGISQVIRPNSLIHLDDTINTGSDGAVSIIFGDDNGTHLDLGRMSTMIIDDDVQGGSLPDLGEVAVESGLLADLLDNWESFEPVAMLDALIPDTAGGADDSAAAEQPPGLEGAPESVASHDAADDGIGSLDDDLDLGHLIPPPDDAS